MLCKKQNRGGFEIGETIYNNFLRFIVLWWVNSGEKERGSDVICQLRFLVSQEKVIINWEQVSHQYHFQHPVLAVL